MDFFTLLKQYHEITFQEFKKDLINNIKTDIINVLNVNKEIKKICGHKRTQNRGYCRRLCSGNACKYHLKYTSTKDANNNIENTNSFSLKSDVSDISEYVNICKYKDISNNIIKKDNLINLKIIDLPKSNIVLKDKLNNFNSDINNYLFNLKSKKNIFKSLITFIILFNKIKLKREKKRIKNKNKKERRKVKIYSSDKLDISKDMKNKNQAIIIKENNMYYTINFYDKKVIADCIEGIICNYCNSIRYTSSGPCINPNCYNRSFDNIEFEIYYKIHKKHKESIYNTILNKN